MEAQINEINDSGIQEMMDLSILSSQDTPQLEHDGYNWRKDNRTIASKLVWLFDHATETLPPDVNFIVDDKQNGTRRVIPVHKFVLSLSSEVFAVSFANNCSDINVKSDESVARKFLQFIYSDEECLGDGLSVAFIIQLFQLAQQYKVHSLISSCLKQLKEKVAPDNVLCIFDLLLGVGETCAIDEMKERCLHLIYENAVQILESSSIRGCSPSAIKELVESDWLNVPEVSLFETVYRWAKHQQDLSKNSKSLRSVLQEILPHIRFPLMTADDFVTTVLPKNILTPEESCEILQYISVSDGLKNVNLPLKFSINPRKNPKQQLLGFMQNNQGFSIGDEIMREDCPLNFFEFLQDLSKVKLRDRGKIKSIVLKKIYVPSPRMLEPTIVRLPNLKNFSFSIISDENLGVDDMEAAVCDKLREEIPKFMFISKNWSAQASIWPYACFWQMGVNVNLKYNHNTILCLDHNTGRIVLNKFRCLGKILKGFFLCKDIFRLSISFKKFEMEPEQQSDQAFSVVQSVKVLTLHDVLNTEMIDFIEGFSNLEQVVLYNCHCNEVSLALLNRSCYKLRKLSISHAFLKISNNNDWDSITFNNLDKLALWNCLWDQHFNEFSSSIFPSVSRVFIYNNFVDNSLLQLLGTLRKLESLENIIVYGYIQGIMNPGKTSVPPTSIQTEEEIKFWGNILGKEKKPGNNVIKVHNEHGFEWKCFELDSVKITQHLYGEFNVEEFVTDIDDFFKSLQ